MRILQATFLGVSFALVLAVPFQAQQVRNVPSAYPTIQSAIAAAVDGDAVLVAPGTYFENISFNGKSIQVRSAVGAAVTIIDGGQAGPVVSFPGGETQDARLDGFTITNGRGGSIAQGFQVSFQAGGIDMRGNASPTIERCLIAGNIGGPALATTVQGQFNALPAGAGGVRTAGSARLVRCTISGNLGGDGQLVLSQFCVTPSTCTVTFGSGGAGGVEVAGTDPLFLDCAIDGNTGGNASIPPGLAAGGDGGMRFTNGTARVVRTRITGNVGGFGAPVPSAAGGARVAFGYVAFDGCLIAGNRGGDVSTTAFPPAPGTGGVVFERPVSFSRCTIAENIAGENFALPAASGVGGIEDRVNPILFGAPATTIENSIAWGNRTFAGAPSQIVVTPLAAVVDVPEVSDSDVQGGFAGTGNLDADPLFVDPVNGDFDLSPGSPCVDVASLPGFILDLAPHDILGRPRWLGARPDVGAYESGAFDAGMLGSGDDFALAARQVGQGSPYSLAKQIYGGGLLGMALFSPAGTLASRYPILVADLFTAGNPPVQGTVFPEVHWSPNRFVVFDGTLTGQSLASAVPLVYTVPPGLAGFVVRVQAIAWNPFSKNGFFSATDAQDLFFN